MNVLPSSKLNTNFCNQLSIKNYEKHDIKKENPITRKGEVANLTKATFVAGLALAGRIMWELAEDGEFVLDAAAKKAKKIVDKNHATAKNSKKFFYKIGAFIAIVAAGACAFATLYTLYNAPKIAYNSNVNKFTKEKEMDVYIKANDVEKELYTQLADNAKNAENTQEKEYLKEQYAKLKIAKNQVPDFVKLDKVV